MDETTTAPELLCGHEYGPSVIRPAIEQEPAGQAEQPALPGTNPDEPALPGM